MLAGMLSHAQESSWVAIGNKGEVVGYLIMSKTIRFPEDGYHIAPLYADSAPIARSLLKVAVEFAAANNPRHMMNPRHMVTKSHTHMRSLADRGAPIMRA